MAIRISNEVRNNLKNLIIQDHSLQELLKLTKLSENFIRSFSKENNLTYKINSNKCTRTANLTEYQKNIIDGLLLSDAGLNYNHKLNYCTPRLSLVSKHLEYVEYIKNVLPFESSILKRSRYDKRTDKIYTAYEYTTKTYLNFISYYQIWYPKFNNYKKTIPANIDINKTSLLHWFLGDGYCSYSCKNYLVIGLCTDSFSLLDVNLLSKLCKDNKIINNINEKNKGQYIIRVYRKESILNFFNLIGKSPVTCFDYKFKA